jgi:hypothetical protein
MSLEEAKVRVEGELQGLELVAVPGATPADVEADGCEALAYVEKRFAPSGEGTVRVPGLVDGGLKTETVDDLRVLTVELRKVNVALLEPVEGFDLARVKVVVGELRDALQCVADGDAKLTALVDGLRSGTPRTKEPSDWVVCLGHHADVAEKQAGRLRALPGFDPAFLDEAQRLRAAYDAGEGGDREALQARRLGLMMLVRDRIHRVHVAADYAFRRHPALARASRSARVRRNAAASAAARRRNRKVQPVEPA